MDISHCNGCRQRDAVIADLEACVARLEAELAKQRQINQRLASTGQRLIDRLAQYEPEARREFGRSPPESGDSGNYRSPAVSYSVDAETQRRRRRRRRKKSPGRQPTELKFADAERVEDLYPPDVRRSECRIVRERAVWRLEEGRAVRVGYRIFASPGGDEPRIPGVTVFPASRRVANTASRSWWCWPFWCTSSAFPWTKPVRCWGSSVSCR